MESIVKFIQEQLDTIRPNAYRVSSERNLNSIFEKHEVIVSSLSGDVYSKSSNIPYQIDILTLDPDQVQKDFFALARNCNNVPFTKIVQTGEENFQSVTYNIVFNTPVAMEKSVDVGTNHYVRLVAFASVNEMSGINQIKSIKIDDEKIETLSSSYNYVTELNSSKISGKELNKSKKRASSYSIVFTSINVSSVFFNKAFKISSGQLPGNTSFYVDYELDNGLKASQVMFITSYQINSERGKLPSVNIQLSLYDTRADDDAPIDDLTNTTWELKNTLSRYSPLAVDMKAKVNYDELYEINFVDETVDSSHALFAFESGATNDYRNRLQFDLSGTYFYDDDTWLDNTPRRIKITGGNDATNMDLIRWLNQNATRVR